MAFMLTRQNVLAVIPAESPARISTIWSWELTIAGFMNMKVMTKCDGCFERIPEGRKPICVEACPMRALDFDEIGILREKYGQQADIAPLPSSEKTNPSLVIRSNRYARPAGDTTGNLQNPQEV